MKVKSTALFVILLIAGASLFAHGSKDGRILGTVKALHENHLMVTSTDGHEVMVMLSADTKIVRGEEPASREDLKEGARVVVEVGEDGKTATIVKIGTAGGK